MFGLFKKKTTKTSSIKTVVVRGREISYVPNSAIEDYRFDTYETKEPETLDWIDQYVKADDILYDIGANVGLYTIYAAQKMKIPGQVFSFEPESQNFVSLNRNILANRLTERVVSVPIALTDKFKIDWFHISGDDFFTGKELKSKDSVDKYVSGAALHSYGEEGDYTSSFFKHLSFGASLDWLCEQDLFPVPNHLKVDVDGLEPYIIAGAKELLKNKTLRTILIEINEGSEGIVDILSAAGFQIEEKLSTKNNKIFARKLDTI